MHKIFSNRFASLFNIAQVNANRGNGVNQAMAKRLVSLLIAFTGVMLMGGSLYFLWLNNANHGAVPLPKNMASLSLTTAKYGPEAAAEITNLHQRDFGINSGAMGMYGSKGDISLWVAGFSSSSAARQMIDTMHAKISAGGSPFSTVGTRSLSARTIYELDGMGQKHFYFQSGRLVIWLAANPGLADQTLAEVLDFYP